MNNEEQSAQKQGERNEITPSANTEYTTPAQAATEQQLRYAEQQIETRMTAFERSMIRLTRYGLAVTILSGLIFAGQLYEMITGSTATDNLVKYSLVQASAASDQADAAQQFSDTADDINSRMSDAVVQLQAAANNAKTGIRATQNAMRLDQRAWVVAKGITHNLAVDNVWKLRFVFTNTGKTPAKNARMTCILDPVIGTGARTWPKLQHPIPTLIAPSEEKGCVLMPYGDEKVTADRLASLKDPNTHVYIYGSVVYQDVFAQWHWLTVCYIMAHQGEDWDNCNDGNDTGEGKIPPPPFS
jgi:hypothetical protein